MRKVERADIIDFVTYGDRRDQMRAAAMAAKMPRRIHVGPHLTFLFENHQTIVYQVQEMMRAEQIVRDADIQHEIDTYNTLLGGPGELGCTLMIEITSPAERDEKLTAWLGLHAHLYARLPDNQKVYATFDAAQVGDTRLSSVQYLLFDVGGVTPVAIGCDFPAHTHEAILDQAQAAALDLDLQQV